MAPRFSRLIGLAALLACATSAGAAQVTRHVVSAEDIRRVGVIRLGELIRLAPWPSVRTVDEFTWRGATGISPVEDDRWALVVDGQLVETALLGVASLSRAPIDLQSIDSVSFEVAASGDMFSRPGAGLIRIYSRLPARGVTLSGRLATGSETGDPGPYAFVPPAAPNQDRFGHDAALGARVALGAWSVSASVSLGVHIATDLAIFDRLLASGAGFPRIEYATPSVRVAYDGAAGRHQLLLASSRIDDWFRVDAVGLESPGRTVLDHGGVAGQFPLAARSAIRYSVVGERSTADFAETQVAPALLVEREGVHAALEAAHRDARLGVAGSHRSVSSSRLPGGDTYDAFRAFGHVELLHGEHVRAHAAGSLDAAAGRVGPALALGGTWDLGADDFSLAVLASEDIGRPHDELWALVSRGFTWLADAGIPVTGAGPGESARAGLSIRWTRTATSRLEFSLDASADVRREAAIPLRMLAVDPAASAWRGPVLLVRNAPGRTAALGAAVVWRDPRLIVEGGYSVRWAGGDSAISVASRAIPRHAGRVAAAWLPVQNLEVTGRLSLRGPSRWLEYGEAALGTLPGTAVLDVGLGKSLWNRRLMTRLGLRNLLDRENRLHPEGADARLSFVVLVEGEFGGPVSGR